MKAHAYNLTNIWEPNPEDCIPYDGCEVTGAYFPLNRTREDIETELNSNIMSDTDTEGLAGWNYDGEIELDDDKYSEYEGRILNQEELEYEKWDNENAPEQI